MLTLVVGTVGFPRSRILPTRTSVVVPDPTEEIRYLTHRSDQSVTLATSPAVRKCSCSEASVLVSVRLQDPISSESVTEGSPCHSSATRVTAFVPEGFESQTTSFASDALRSTTEASWTSK